MALETYRAKRDFRRTPEPRGTKRVAKPGERSFVVQKHAASHLHYDFRLEHNGVLLSWAVPKGPSLDPADKRLAMHVEDHPLEYGGFEGIIPKGEYGGGTVMVWDRGDWTPIGDPGEGYAKGNLKFTLDGEKLKGNFALVRTRGSKYGGKSGAEAWLLIKEKDAFARPGKKPVVEAAPDSVASGRSIEEIAQARAHVWRSKLSVKANVKAGAVAPRVKGKAGPPPRAAIPTGAKKAPMPATLAPVLATLVARAPDGDDWINEIKYDGYRMLCRVDGGRARLYSRTGKDWTKSFAAVAKDLAALPVKRAWIDGEVVVLDEKGRTSFQALQNALSAATPKDVAFFAFDLPYVDGLDLRDSTLTERKRLLRGVVGDGAGTVKVGPEARGGSADFFRQACALGLEGIICKKTDSAYAVGTRSREWLKVKCLRRQEMVVGGYTDPQGSRAGFGALLLGYFDGGALRYAGKVGTGFDDELLRTLAAKLRKLEVAVPAFANPPRGFAAKGAHWVRPELVAEVAFTEWSNDGALRHPSFQGLRLDKTAADVVREVPVDAGAGVKPRVATKRTPAAKAKAKPTTAAKRSATMAGAKSAEPRSGRTTPPIAAKTASIPPATPLPARKAKAARISATSPDPVSSLVEGVKLSHADKPYFPEAGITKGDIARYYATIAPWLLPHLAGRPLSMVRCPDGWSGQCFYQKNADRSVNAAVKRVEVPTSDGPATYFSAASATALVGLVQWGVIELHPWGSRLPRLDRPDTLIFDFDPDDAIKWKELVAAVGLLRTLLDEMKLTGFLKTTGGKGLHVVLPIRPTLAWPDAKAFTKSVADFLVRTFPDRFTAALAKEKRRGKIFIDYLRNAEGATAVAPYAVRARKNAPVATPIAWKELARDVRFDHFNVGNLAKRVTTVADPWADYFATKQSITAAMRKRLA